MMPGNQPDDEKVIAEGQNQEGRVADSHDERAKVADVEQEPEERRKEPHQRVR